MIAYFYPYGSVLWTMLFFYVWMMWLFLLFRVFAAIFRSDDLGGGAKALWLIFVIVLPFLGVLIYVTSRGNSMSPGSGKYTPPPPTADTIASEIGHLAQLRSSGDITDAEFEAQKARLLG